MVEAGDGVITISYDFCEHDQYHKSGIFQCKNSCVGLAIYESQFLITELLDNEIFKHRWFILWYRHVWCKFTFDNLYSEVLQAIGMVVLAEIAVCLSIFSCYRSCYITRMLRRPVGVDATVPAFSLPQHIENFHRPPNLRKHEIKQCKIL